MTLEGVDLLESGDERERLSLRRALSLRPPQWAVTALAALLAATLAAGVVGAVQVSRERAREAARVEVDVAFVDSASSTVGGVARGRVDLLLANRRDHRVRVEELRWAVEGVQVLRVEPPLELPLGPYTERLLRVSYAVPDCSRLVLPGSLTLSLRGPAEAQSQQVTVYDPRTPDPPADGVPFAACPRSSVAGTPATGDIAARPAGGTAERTGQGAEGTAWVEIRNGGRPVRLLSVTARVPGVVFTPRVLEGGRTIAPDGVVVVRLRFRIEDCDRLQQAGWLTIELERFGAQQEVGLRLTAEPAGGLGPQVPLPVVLDACD